MTGADGTGAHGDATSGATFLGKTVMHPANMALLTYWRMAGDGKPLPQWAEIDLLELTAYLQNLLLLEWEGANDAPLIRFAGPSLVRWTGAEPTGRTVCDLVGRIAGTALTRDIAPVRQGTRIGLMCASLRTHRGNDVLLEFLNMPLTDERGRVRYVLTGCQWLSGTLEHGGEIDCLDPTTIRVERERLLPLREDEAADRPVPAQAVGQ